VQEQHNIGNKMSSNVYPSSFLSYSKVGDVFHVLTLINVFSYAFLVLKFAQPTSDSKSIFDEKWQSQGFCVQNIDKPYWNSHDLCLYTDSILAIGVAILYMALCNTPTEGMKRVNPMMKWQSLSIFTHGIAHGMISYGLRQKQSGGVLSSASATSAFSKQTKLIMGLVFWFPMIKSFLDQWHSSLVFFLSLLVVLIGQTFVPDLYGFMYVQTVISIIFAWQQLQQKKHEKEHYAYMLFAFVTLPISIIPWFESMACSQWFMDYGGHVLYDASIPLFLSAVYVACWWRERSLIVQATPKVD